METLNLTKSIIIRVKAFLWEYVNEKDANRTVLIFLHKHSMMFQIG